MTEQQHDRDAGPNGAPAPARYRRRWLLLAAGAGLVMVLLVLVPLAAGLWFLRATDDGPEPPRGNLQNPAPALVASDDPARGAIVFADDDGTVDGIVPGPELTVVLTPPPGATEVQVGFDPTFARTPWVPVGDQLVLATDRVGYQVLFGRFRSGPEAVPSPVSTDGIVVDPTYAAAVASVDGRHRASWVRPVGPDRLVVRIEGGRLVRGAQEPYDFDDPPEGDDVDRWFGPVNVSRDGEPLGIRVEGHDDLLRHWDRLAGRPVDTDRLDDGLWLVRRPDGTEIRATGVERISRAAGSGFGPDGRIVPLVHDVIVTLEEPLAPGVDYVLQPPVDVAPEEPVTIDWTSSPSPAVHVNQHGYEIGDPLKVGYLSRPFFETGGVEPYRAGAPFTVHRVETGEVAASGVLTARPGGDEVGEGDLTGAPVFEADFSTLDAPGRYRLCVEEVGCSEPFAIDEHRWEILAVEVARAMYHQRSGIALGPPYTPIERPRPYHPDDGHVVNTSDLTLLDTLDIPVGDVFPRLIDGAGDEVAADAWGGHFDAGDWDRRIQHLYYVRAAVEVVALDPERWEQADLQLPESGDAVPDLLDEALWTLDLFRRLQRPDGAVSGGIEAADHPRPDATSWSDDLAVYTYTPDPYSTYLYAGVAAQVAVALEPYDPLRAALFADSALAAAAWAETAPVPPGAADGVRAQRAVAAAALLALTGDRVWHDVFLDASDLDDGVDAFLSCHAHAACDAGWLYLQVDPSLTDPALRASIEASFVATAEEIVAGAETTAFGWSLENPHVPLIWGLGPGGSPSAIGLLRAHVLTGDDRYRAAAQRSAAVSLGANPANTVYITGFGRQPVSHPLIVDVNHGGLPLWPGTPVYGPHRLNLFDDESWVETYLLEPAGVDPLPTASPYLWQFQDVSHVAMFNEYTVFQSHAAALYAYGLLARD